MSGKPKLLVTRLTPPNVEARIARDYDAITNPDDVIWSTAALLVKADGCDAILCSPTEPMPKDVIDRLPDSVKALATFSVGYDHIDVAAATTRGIKIGNTPDVLDDATADIAMLCLLGAARMAYNATTVLRSGQWKRWEPTGLLGVHVTGKRLGILGMGRIGRALAKRARGFDMEIHYSNRSRLAPDLEQGAIFHADPDDMLPHCDFISFNCPLTEKTRHFLNADRIQKLPKGAVVVNTARGPVVDDKAVIAALKSGRIAAAGLDVFEDEPNFDRAYLDLPNTFLLPHIGSATVETRDAMGNMCLDNLDAFFAGKPMPGPVN